MVIGDRISTTLLADLVDLVEEIFRLTVVEVSQNKGGGMKGKIFRF